jgi:signal peptidase
MVGGEAGAHAPVHERTSDSREDRGARSRTPFYVALVLIYSVLGLLLVFAWPGMFGFNTYTGLGTSMGDAIPSGSLLVTRSVDPADIEVGDVISFRYPGVENPITHRVIAIRERNGSFAFATQGDGNRAPDRSPVSGDQDIERVIYTKPYLGLVLPFARALLLSGALGGLSFLWIVRRRARLARELRARDTFGIAVDGR